MVGPWDAKIEGGIGGADSTLGAVVTKLRITIDLDQPLPFAGGGPIPAIDFPPMVKSVRLEGGELVLKRGGQTQTLSWRGEFSQAGPGDPRRCAGEFFFVAAERGKSDDIRATRSGSRTKFRFLPPCPSAVLSEY